MRQFFVWALKFSAFGSALLGMASAASLGPGAGIWAAVYVISGFVAGLIWWGLADLAEIIYALNLKLILEVKPSDKK